MGLLKTVFEVNINLFGKRATDGYELEPLQLSTKLKLNLE